MFKSAEEVVRTAGPPKEEDRFTAVFQASYLEWETGNTVNCRWAYDRLLPGAAASYQNELRVNPGKEQEIYMPPGEYEIVLGHKAIELRGVDPLMAEQQKGNVIEIYQDGKLLTALKAGRMTFGGFPGKLTAKSTKTTALLHITAFPC